MKRWGAFVACAAAIGCGEPARPPAPPPVTTVAATPPPPPPPAPSASATPSASSSSSLAAEADKMQLTPIGSCAGDCPSSAGSGLAPASSSGPITPGYAPTVVGPKGNVIVGAVVGVSGADAPIAKNHWRFRACYQKALQSDPSVDGKLALSVTSASDGTVTAVTPDPGSVTHTGLVQCVAGAMKNINVGVGGTFKVPIAFAKH